jgi:hypothetical protein
MNNFFNWLSGLFSAPLPHKGVMTKNAQASITKTDAAGTYTQAASHGKVPVAGNYTGLAIPDNDGTGNRWSANQSNIKAQR